MQAKHHMTTLIAFSSKYPSWKTLEGSITATKTLKSFRINGVEKLRNIFKIGKICFLGGIF